MKIGVDVDSVVCELMPTIMEHISKKVGKTYTIDDVINWEMNFDGEDLYENIVEVLNSDKILLFPTVPLSKDCIDILSYRGSKICFITSRRSSLEENTKRWIEYNFGYYEVFHAGNGEDKNGYEIDILIDDAPHHIKDFVDGGGYAILFDRPWNRDMGKYEDCSRMLRAKGWKDVLFGVSVLEELIKWDLKTKSKRLKHK
jgi:5'(3')-deoxyribonucleotidase